MNDLKGVRLLPNIFYYSYDDLFHFILNTKFYIYF